MDRDLVIYNKDTSIKMNKRLTFEEMLEFNNLLSQNEIAKIKKAYISELEDMAAEFLWSRTISVLKQNIMRFGEEFIAETLDKNPNDIKENISQFEVINLAFELGFINNVAKIELLHYSEIINYYICSDDPEDEFPTTKFPDLLRICIKYVLGAGKTEFEGSLTPFRDQLKSRHLEYSICEEIRIAPYFYKKTVNKLILNLAKNTKDSAEREVILSNMVMILTDLWKDLESEDKWLIGREYAQANNEGETNLIKALRKILLNVKGFDFVPENLRSNSYIKMANQLLNAHYQYNNFYNEPVYAKQLFNMGESIPVPAIGTCMTAILACKIGNRYGVAESAQETLDSLLGKITEARWEYYISKVLPTDEVILSKLSETYSSENWGKIVEKYNLKSEMTSIREVQELLELKNIKKAAKALLEKYYSKK